MTEWLKKIIAKYHKLFAVVSWLLVLCLPLSVFIGKKILLLPIVILIGIFSSLGGLSIQTDAKKYQDLIKKYKDKK